MAAPITHIVLANKIFKTHFYNYNKDKSKFFIGTSFPDIRYLGTVSREKTHLEVNNLAEIITEDAFNSGIKLHVFVDKIREEFITSKGVYEIYSKSRASYSAIKFLEDEYLYNEITDWSLIGDYFNDILKEEISYGVSEETVKTWHNLLQDYFSQKVDTHSIERFSKRLKIDPAAVHEITSLIEAMKKNSKIKEVIMEFYNSFTQLISS